MKKIKLTRGQFAIVDDEDYERTNQYKWWIHIDKYAAGREKNKYILMHRFLMNCPTSMEVDHINGNGLDNRKSNLRICTHKENIYNSQKSKNNTSGYVGVRFFKYDKRNKKWQAYISPKNEFKSLGYYFTKEEAAVAYNQAAIKYFGEFARLNKI